MRRKRSFFLRAAEQIPFRRRGKTYIALIVLILAALAAVSVGIGLREGLEAPIRTVKAVPYESGSGYFSTGYIVRDEAVMTMDSSITSLVPAEGERVSAGQAVAMGYVSADAQTRQRKIAQLEERLKELEYASGASAAAYNKAAADMEIRDKILEMAVMLGRGNVLAVGDAAPNLKGLVLRSTASEEDLSAIARQEKNIREERDALRAQLSGQMRVVSAPASGYFSGVVDGYESVLTPRSLEALSPTELDRIAADAQPAGAFGKLVLGDTWYYVTTIPEAELKETELGDSAEVSFAHDLRTAITMRISHISQPENGRCVVVFTCGDYIRDVTMMRSQSADIVFRSYAGLRVPKEAVHVREDGKVGVYVLESAAYKWKTVEILYDNGESYIVRLDKSSTRNLWPGDDIIVDDKDAYDGKVVV